MQKQAASVGRGRPPGPECARDGNGRGGRHSGQERGQTWAYLGVSGTVASMTPATGAVVGAGFQGASSGRETENLTCFMELLPSRVQIFRFSPASSFTLPNRGEKHIKLDEKLAVFR